MSYPTTDDTPELLAVLPDWQHGIQHRQTYRTEVARSRAGLEQRSQHRRRAILVMEYTATGLHDAAACRRLDMVVRSSRKPLVVPWWCSGTTLQSTMPSDTAAVLATNPVADDWDRAEWVYFWHRTLGGEFRQLAGRTGTTLTLVDTGTHVQFPAGSFAFPALLAVREKDEALLENPRHRTAADRLIFRAL